MNVYTDSLSGFLLDLGQPLPDHVDLDASASCELLDPYSDLKTECKSSVILWPNSI